ncbi:MAG: hypothetical protein SGPRY_006035, partial [Prymnesium sp.]
AVEAVRARTAQLESELAMRVETAPPPLPPFTWSLELDPAAAELNESRANRKRQQIASAARHVLGLAGEGSHLVECGAGQGHLGLLVAHLRPDLTVTLVEVKQYSCDAARERIRRIGMNNVRVFQGTVEEFDSSQVAFDVVVGLHLCG